MKFDWQSFYEEFAAKIKNSNPSDLYNKVKNSRLAAGLSFPETWKGWPVNQIDPFSAFASINCRCSDIKRTLFLYEIKQAFGLTSDVPGDFSGIPQFENRNLFMFHVDDHVAERIDELWEMFSAAIAYSENQNNEDEFVRRYSALEQQKNVAYGLTIGLFCMRPDIYVSLDKRNRSFIFSSHRMSERFVAQYRHINKDYKDGAAYLNFCRALRIELESGNSDCRNFPALSLAAYEWDCNGRHKVDLKGHKSLRHCMPDKKSLQTLQKWLSSQNETSRLGTAVQRIGQGELRKYMLAKQKMCPITQIKRPELLIVSHIKDWKDCAALEHLDPENVLLLAKNYDAVFDKHLISFNKKDGRIIKAARIEWEELERMGISPRAKIHVASQKQAEYLAYHQDVMAQKDKSYFSICQAMT